jgi:hemoglobin-like flavoprotein
MEQTAHALARESYDRCLRSSRFFHNFYEHLLASDPAVPPMFAKTEFPKQYKLLQHGLGLLLSYAKKPDEELLERIALRHSLSGVNVQPSMYPMFVDSLLATVRQHDPRCTEETEAAWREALRPGIEFMQSRY